MTIGTPTDPFASLHETLRGDYWLPDHPEYEARRRVWNRAHDRHPAIIVRPHGTADVAHAVRWADAEGFPIAVQGGGHHAAGFGTCDDGMVLDMSAMRSVLVNPAENTVVVQGGARAADVIRETQLFGLAVPTGNLGAVGMAGITLGGGMGYLRRKYGLTCDSLTAADLVLADGTAVHVDALHEPDLFWAIRGGGGNFGVATALHYRLHRVGPTVLGIQVMYSARDLRPVLRGVRDFLADASHDISLNIDVVGLPPRPGLPPELAGERVVMLSGMHAGADLAQAAQEAAPLSEFAPPLMNLTGPVSYSALHGRLDAMLPPDHCGYLESTYVKQFSDTLIDQIATIVDQSGPLTHIGLWPMGGKMAEPSADATAFGDRKAAAVLMLEAGWQAAEEAADAQAWVAFHRDRLEAHVYNGGTYLNLTEAVRDPATLIKNTYGANLRRLEAVKRQYDPKNTFRFNLNIDPTADEAVS